MKSFASQIEIAASTAEVWNILTELPRWTQWNTTIERTEGSVGLGAKVVIYAKQTPGRAFPLRVTELDAPRRMVWCGGMPFGLFTGERTYELSTLPTARSLFTMRERYTGAMAALISRSIPDLQPAFDEFARCLKVEAEHPGKRL
jgi:hypothetical protein